MTPNAPQESAEIIQFPLRGRFAPDLDRSSAFAPSRFAGIAIGASWYHQDAIEEERARKN